MSDVSLLDSLKSESSDSSLFISLSIISLFLSIIRLDNVLLFPAISNCDILFNNFLTLDFDTFFLLNTSSEKYFDNNDNLCSNNINSFILSPYDKLFILSDKNIKFSPFNLNNLLLGNSHFLLLSNDISPVNKSIKLYGFSEHFLILDSTNSLNNFSFIISPLVLSNMPSISLISNILFNNVILISVSYASSKSSLLVIIEKISVSFLTYLFTLYSMIN